MGAASVVNFTYLAQDRARPIYSELQSRGIRCWLDEHQMLPGDDMTAESDSGTRSCSAARRHPSPAGGSTTRLTRRSRRSGS